MNFFLFLFFFFQAEDGIRDYKVTGVQTCALPIYSMEGLEEVLSNYTGNKTFASNFFTKFIFGHEPFDYATPLKQAGIDRKSTRLNSSHLVISYAVFCLKKKKK